MKNGMGCIISSGQRDGKIGRESEIRGIGLVSKYTYPSR